MGRFIDTSSEELFSVVSESFPTSPQSITVAEAKRRLRAGYPLCGQLVRGLFSKVVMLGASTGPWAKVDCRGEWRIFEFPRVANPEHYDDSKLRLTISTRLPSLTSGLSLMKLLPHKEWNEIRQPIFERAGRQCEICCGTNGLSCHEVWEWNENTSIQSLTALRSLCGRCHAVVHLEFTESLASKGRVNYHAIVEHFCQVNQCSSRHFLVHRNRALRLDLEEECDDVAAKRSPKHPPLSRRQVSPKIYVDFGEYNDLVPARAKGPHWRSVHGNTVTVHHGEQRDS